MLDSLVRVSRRVGWGADRLATDPELDGATPGPRPPAVPEHCEQSSGVERTEKAGARRRGGFPRSGGRPYLRRSVTLDAEATSHLPAGLLTASEPVVALSPRKVRPATTARTGAGPLGSDFPPDGRTPS